MDLFVQKYGGSSVETIERIKGVADRVIKTKTGGHSVVVVVSALGDTTDELMEKAYGITPYPPEREMDMLLSTGEQISAALLAMAIQSLGHDAISLTGYQVGIVTDSSHTKAKIIDINFKRIYDELTKDRIVIVAGFQGATVDHDITTLGRGGSDTTAVALAAGLKAETCEIYTDVDGVYTADPRIVSDARKIAAVSYEEMLEMAATGAKVLQMRSVEYARNYNVMIHVRSSFEESRGTVVKGVEEKMERPIISAVTHDMSEGKMTIFEVPDKPGIAAHIFKALADANVNVDMIVQNVSQQGATDISFTLNLDDLTKAEPAIEAVVQELGAKGFSCDKGIAKVSIIGAGMKSHPGIAAEMFEVLAENNVNIQMISTSPIKIACVIDMGSAKKAVRALHKHFNLGREAVIDEAL